MRTTVLMKLLGGFGVVVGLMLAIGVLALGQIESDHAHLQELSTHVVPVTRAVGDISSLMNEYRKDQLHYIVARPAERPLGVAGSIAGDLASDLSAMSARLEAAQDLIDTPADTALQAAFSTSFSRYVALTQSFRALADAGRDRQAADVVGDGPGDREYNRLKALIAAWNARIIQDANAASAVSNDSYSVGRTLLVIVLLTAIAVSLAVAVFLGRSITRAVRRVGAAATAIAQGDLDQRIHVDSRDELGDMSRDFGLMIDYLTTISGVAESIAAGDLSVDVQPRSDHDRLGRSLAAMTHSLRVLVSEKERLIEQIPGVVMVFDALPDGSRRFEFVSRQSEAMLGFAAERFLTEPELFATHVHAEDRERVLAALGEPTIAGREPRPAEFRFLHPDGEERWLREEAALVTGDDGVMRIQAVLFDTTAAKQAELERQRLDLRLAQKLEAVGQLAAGVAHEINTPIQFIGDSVTFLKESADELLELTAVYRELLHSDEMIDREERRRRAEDAEQVADLDYLIERVPPAFTRALDGIGRVTKIVRAMRQFAHPSTQRAPIDINEALQTTLTVATNEYKYVADIALDLEELPPVMANVSDLNQVFLNLIVNAAHAIESVVGAGEAVHDRGTITVRSRRHEESVLITVGDTGCGIPPEIASRVFDPFFTTKPVGRGTGQGLAIAHTIIVERHHGAIHHEAGPDGGTVFEIRLPIDGLASEAAAELPRAA
jgi:PAS domain S-box-containing protein